MSELDPAQCRVKLSAEQIEHLRSEIARTGVAVTALLKTRTDAPEGLHPHLFTSWVNRGITARLDYYQYLLRAWRSLPDAKKPAPKMMGRIRMTSEMVELLRVAVERTQVPLTALFHSNDELPRGLTYSTVKGWFKGTRTVYQEHYDYVLNFFDALPKVERQPKTRQNGHSLEIEIMHSTVIELRRLQHESGLSPKTLLQAEDNAPVGLNHLIVHQWMARKKKWAPKEWLDYVLDSWRQAAEQSA